MRALAALLAALVLVAGCGGSKRSQADMDRDGRTIAAALETADSDGASFHLAETWLITGGQVPKGQQSTVSLTADGAARSGRVKMTLKFTTGSTKPSYDLVIADSFLYAKPHSGDAVWKRTTAMAGTALYPAALLELVRESVLLAKRVGAYSLVQQGNGFAHKYVVVPASDQLEQLQAITLTGADEQAFLKSATAEIDVLLTVTGNKLQRVEVHLVGTEPSTGTKNRIDSTSDYKAAKVDTIAVPTGAADVQPSQLFGG
jgi:hypothetical protein